MSNNINIKGAQRQLDLAAEKLDKQGHKDLADKVDLCNAKLVKASDEERKVIASVLEKINKEVNLRNGETDEESESPNRLAMQRRKAAVRKRLQEKLAAKRLEKALLDGLDLTASSERNENALRMWRKERVKKARLAALEEDE